MAHGDFKANEKSVTLAKPANLSIVWSDGKGASKVLKEEIKVLAGEIVDSSVMEKKALLEFLYTQLKDAKEKGILFSVHLKATMMKVSDPIIFGHVLKCYFESVFDKHAGTFEKLGIDPNNGLESLLEVMSQRAT